MNFKALARLRKRQFEQAEKELAAVNAELDRLKARREALRADMRAVEPPRSGRGTDLAAVVAQKRAHMKAIEALDGQIEAVTARKREKERALKAAHIAYEQAKSLESQALAVLMARRARQERSRLDEIAGQRFWRDRNGKGERA